MAKWGLFHSGASEPYQTFDGESIVQREQYVYVLDKEKEQVAAIKLADGQYVKKLQG